MEAQDEFLSRQRIRDILQLDQAQGKKDTQDVIRKPGDIIWIRNVGAAEAGQDNAQKPFYKMSIISDEGKKVKCKLAPVPDEEKCTESNFTKPVVEIDKHDGTKDLVMDYSRMAEEGLQDMIEIDELNHATILYNLYRRYIKDEIYTYVGPTLLAVNPFKNMSAKFPPSVIKDYQ